MISLLLGLITIGLLVYYILRRGTRNYDRFKDQGLKYIKPIPIIGNSQYAFTNSLNKKLARTYAMFPTEKVIGIFEFTTPIYFLRDLELIKQLTVKDFQHFQDHSTFVDGETDDFFGNMLFSMTGKHWRDMRSSLSPMFTGSKMRTMLQLISNCNKQMEVFIRKENEEKGVQSHSMKDIFSRYTNDVIASCAFGVECDSLKQPKNEIYLLGQNLLEFQKPSQMWKFIIMQVYPKLARMLNVKVLGPTIRRKFFDLIINTMEVRKRENINRPDMLQLLMKLKEGKLGLGKDEEMDHENKMIDGEIKKTWTDIELVAQCFLFFVAGFDTSSTAMAFMAYELAVNPDIQDKLREEVDEINESLAGQPLNYEALQKMKYMHMVISETLRKWPPANLTDRQCVKEYTCDDGEGLNFTIKEDSQIWIPIHSIHMDPKYFPNPDKFDPERFSDENKTENITNAYMPFGLGPRSCIGIRFALMEIKALFFFLLLHFKINPNDETQIPLKLKEAMFTITPEKEIKLSFEPRNDKNDLIKF